MAEDLTIEQILQHCKDNNGHIPEWYVETYQIKYLKQFYTVKRRATYADGMLWFIPNL